MASQDQIEFIYKILPSAPATPLPSEFPLSNLDRNDGFIHLSMATQVPNTASLFFNETTELWLVKLPLTQFGDSIKWENEFPHLYGNFGASNVNSVEKFTRKEGQIWPDVFEASSWLE